MSPTKNHYVPKLYEIRKNGFRCLDSRHMTTMKVIELHISNLCRTVENIPKFEVRMPCQGGRHALSCEELQHIFLHKWKQFRELTPALWVNVTHFFSRTYPFSWNEFTLLYRERIPSFQIIQGCRHSITPDSYQILNTGSNPFFLQHRCTAKYALKFDDVLYAKKWGMYENGCFVIIITVCLMFRIQIPTG